MNTSLNIFSTNEEVQDISSSIMLCMNIWELLYKMASYQESQQDDDKDTEDDLTPILKMLKSKTSQKNNNLSKENMQDLAEQEISHIQRSTSTKLDFNKIIGALDRGNIKMTKAIFRYIDWSTESLGKLNHYLGCDMAFLAEITHELLADKDKDEFLQFINTEGDVDGNFKDAYNSLFGKKPTEHPSNPNLTTKDKQNTETSTI